jgi:hypothetical protein
MAALETGEWQGGGIVIFTEDITGRKADGARTREELFEQLKSLSRI